MSKNNQIPEVNAGSMADIAFLLLIFFLVTATIQTDVGLERKLPPKDTTPPVEINERNIFRVQLNMNNELFVEDSKLNMEELKSAAIAFLDNGGTVAGDTYHCDYCKGEHSNSSSDSPQEAIIAFNADRNAKYSAYVMVQNELTSAYNALRNREATRLFNTSYTDMLTQYDDGNLDTQSSNQLKERIYQIREMYPMKLTEAETKF